MLILQHYFNGVKDAVLASALSAIEARYYRLYERKRRKQYGTDAGFINNDFHTFYR
jgi:hypothetical protein